MNKIRKFISNQLAKQKINPIYRLFLTGLKGQLEITYAKPYAYYSRILGLFATIGYAYYFLKFREREMDVKGYNILVPNYVYKVREENHVYWETVRNAQDLPTMFTYYKWDENLMF